MNYAGFTKYIDEVRDLPFKWGEHDCIRFVNNGCLALTGHTFANGGDWVYTDESGARRSMVSFLRSHGVKDMVGFFDKIAKRTKFPVPGVVVVRKDDAGFIVGFVVDTQRVTFVAGEGLVFTPISDDDMYWSLV